jgi:hypothetical protein
MFAKISNDFLNKTVDYTEFNSNIATDSYYNETRKGGSKFLLLKNLTKFWDLHLYNIFTIKPTVRYAIFSGSGLVSPHVDGGNDSVSLNFYLQTNSDDATIFYKKNNDFVKPYPKTNAYNIDDLTEVSRFYANKYDAYLLDVQQIHGIQKVDSQDRIFIAYRWKKHTFEEVYNSLNIEKHMWKI